MKRRSFLKKCSLGITASVGLAGCTDNKNKESNNNSNNGDRKKDGNKNRSDSSNKLGRTIDKNEKCRSSLFQKTTVTQRKTQNKNGDNDKTPGWNTYQKNNSRNAYLPNVKGPNEHPDVEIVEKLDLETEVDITKTFGTSMWFDVSPVIVDGVAYVSGYGKEVAAIDLSNDERIWTFETENRASFSISYSDEVLYFGDDKATYAIDANTGEEIWSKVEFPAQTFKYPSQYTPVVTDDHLFVTTEGTEILKIDKDTGKNVWSQERGAYQQHVSLSYSEGILYGCAGTNPYELDNSEIENIGDIFAIDTESREFIWNKEDYSGLIYSYPCIVGDDLYFTTIDGKLVSMNSSNGEENWVFEMEDGPRFVHSTPVVSDGCVYSQDEHSVYCVDVSSGEEVWSFDIGETNSSPIVGDDVLYVSNMSRGVFGLDKRDGSPLWISENVPVSSSLTLYDNNIYLIGQRGVAGKTMGKSDKASLYRLGKN